MRWVIGGHIFPVCGRYDLWLPPSTRNIFVYPTFAYSSFVRIGWLQHGRIEEGQFIKHTFLVAMAGRPFDVDEKELLLFVGVTDDPAHPSYHVFEITRRPG